MVEPFLTLQTEQKVEAQKTTTLRSRLTDRGRSDQGSDLANLRARFSQEALPADFIAPPNPSEAGADCQVAHIVALSVGLHTPLNSLFDRSSATAKEVSDLKAHELTHESLGFL